MVISILVVQKLVTRLRTIYCYAHARNKNNMHSCACNASQKRGLPSVFEERFHDLPTVYGDRNEDSQRSDPNKLGKT